MEWTAHKRAERQRDSPMASHLSLFRAPFLAISLPFSPNKSSWLLLNQLIPSRRQKKCNNLSLICYLSPLLPPSPPPPVSYTVWPALLLSLSLQQSPPPSLNLSLAHTHARTRTRVHAHTHTFDAQFVAVEMTEGEGGEKRGANDWKLCHVSAGWCGKSAADTSHRYENNSFAT